MLKIAHIRKPEPEAVRELAAIFIADDLKRQEKEIIRIKKLRIQKQKAASTANA